MPTTSADPALPRREDLPTRRTALRHGVTVSLGVSSLILPAASAAASEFGTSPLSASGTGYPAPDGLAATPGDTTVTVSWNAVGGVSGTPLYQVQYRTGSGDWSVHPLTSATTATVTALANGTEYDFRVIATDGTPENVSDPSAEVAATPVLAAPGVPAGLSVAPGSTGALVVTWSAGAGSEPTSYDVRYGEDGTDPSTWTSVPDVTDTTATISGLTNGTAYAVQVRASNTAGDSEWTDSVTGTPVGSLETTVAAPEPEPPVVAVLTAPTSALITTDKDENVEGTLVNAALVYEYSTDAANWTDAGVTTAAPAFTVADVAGATTVTVRKRTSGGSVVGTSRVTLTPRSASYSAGQVYTVTNAGAGSAARIGTMTATVIGGSGGVGGNDSTRLGGAPSQPGQVVATLTLTAGAVVTVAAGSGGAAGASNVSNSAGSGGLGGTNAFTGYAGGRGAAAGRYGASGQGGGGGAASVVKVGGQVVVVAGGAGGGGGAEFNEGAGANGEPSLTGGFSGTTGQDGLVFTGQYDDAGGGGGGGGGAVGGSRGGQTGGCRVNCGYFDGQDLYRYRSTPSRRGTSTVDGTIATVASGTTSDFASGRADSASGVITLSYLEATEISAVPAD